MHGSAIARTASRMASDWRPASCGPAGGSRPDGRSTWPPLGTIRPPRWRLGRQRTARWVALRPSQCQRARETGNTWTCRPRHHCRTHSNRTSQPTSSGLRRSRHQSSRRTWSSRRATGIEPTASTSRFASCCPGTKSFAQLPVCAKPSGWSLNVCSRTDDAAAREGSRRCVRDPRRIWRRAPSIRSNVAAIEIRGSDVHRRFADTRLRSCLEISGVSSEIWGERRWSQPAHLTAQD